MRIIETALYKLALNETITLDEAKILKALYKCKAASRKTLESQTGLCSDDVAFALGMLKFSKIVTENGGIFFCENFLEKLSELIRKDKLTAKKQTQLPPSITAGSQKMIFLSQMR